MKFDFMLSLRKLTLNKRAADARSNESANKFLCVAMKHILFAPRDVIIDRRIFI